MSDSTGYVYMLTNDRGNVLYIGSTCDLKERISFHKRRLIPGFTKKYNVTKLVYFEKLAGLDEALLREKYLKGKTRKKKDTLIQTINPAFRDLTPDL
jgi:putative endonuclease